MGSNRKFDCKAAIPIQFSSLRENKENEKRIFVGGLKKNWTEVELKEYFQQFGKIDTCYIAKKKDSEISRKFGFVFFDQAEVLRKVFDQEKHIIKGVEVFVKQLKPRKTKENASPTKVVEKAKKPKSKKKQYKAGSKDSGSETAVPQMSSPTDILKKLQVKSKKKTCINSDES